MLATYIRRMLNSNPQLRIAGSSMLCSTRKKFILRFVSVCLIVCLFYFNLVVFDLFFNSAVLSLVGFSALIYEHKLIFPDGRFEDSLRGHRY